MVGCLCYSARCSDEDRPFGQQLLASISAQQGLNWLVIHNVAISCSSCCTNAMQLLSGRFQQVPQNCNGLLAIATELGNVVALSITTDCATEPPVELNCIAMTSALQDCTVALYVSARPSKF